MVKGQRIYLVVLVAKKVIAEMVKGQRSQLKVLVAKKVSVVGLWTQH